METRIDHIVGGIYRISTMTETYGITFNQFLIDDERPTLVHTGDHFLYENIRNGDPRGARPGHAREPRAPPLGGRRERRHGPLHGRGPGR